jgi:hypothetical protein
VKGGIEDRDVRHVWQRIERRADGRHGGRIVEGRQVCQSFDGRKVAMVDQRRSREPFPTVNDSMPDGIDPSLGRGNAQVFDRCTDRVRALRQRGASRPDNLVLPDRV